ncbi:MAG: DUF192 domain-containing protein [Candidatus Yonathbacteria bacterium]|nr:DUF192 domain-containing protein [Candidatus Yonathbacteria bacterium]
MKNVFNMNNKKTLFTGVVILFVFIAVYYYGNNVLKRNNNYQENIPSPKNYVLKIGDISINVDIVDTPALQERGLSGKNALLDNQGMFFIFDHSGIYPFWMKEMNFPIDIIWIDEHMSVADITKNVLPSSFPQTFASRVPIRYVLEVQAGFAERHGVNIGDQVVLSDSN